MDVILSFSITLTVIFVMPILVYALFSALYGLEEPDKKLSFFTGVLVQKTGTSIGFVSLFYLGREYFIEHWLLYSLVWFAMYALTEFGQAFMPNYSPKEALAGVISEAVYFPLAAYITALLIS